MNTAKRRNVILVLFLGFALFFSGLLAVRNGAMHMTAAALPESSQTEVVVEAKPVEKEVVAPAKVESVETAAGTVKTLGAGEASYYGPCFAGRPTANGERFNPAEMTAAHRTLPFGSKVRVTNNDNGRSVVVRINDRGPYAHNRVIDLSKGAAEKIGMLSSGTANVRLEVLS